MAGTPRDPLSAGFSWAYRLMSVGLEFCLPALLGVFLDRRWGSTPWATLVGAAFGFGLGMYHLLRMTQAKPPGSNPPA
ncbi:MAG: AtpZ/AtpI family protein [Isosphaeraceae bacterium]